MTCENTGAGHGSLACPQRQQQVLYGGHLTVAARILSIQRLMSANVPETLDAWRMVVARRRFDGQVSLAELTRLQGLVADTDGECNYSLEFGRDDVLRVSYVELTIDTALPLTCQRSMQRFLLPVKVTQRLGLIRDEDEESSLPEEYEALLVPEDGQLKPLDLVEDELVLAVPVVPLSPDGEAVDKDWAPSEEETKKANPFAALAALKKQ